MKTNTSFSEKIELERNRLIQCQDRIKKYKYFSEHQPDLPNKFYEKSVPDFEGTLKYYFLENRLTTLLGIISFSYFLLTIYFLLCILMDIDINSTIFLNIGFWAVPMPVCTIISLYLLKFFILNKEFFTYKKAIRKKTNQKRELEMKWYSYKLENYEQKKLVYDKTKKEYFDSIRKIIAECEKNINELLKLEQESKIVFTNKQNKQPNLKIVSKHIDTRTLEIISSDRGAQNRNFSEATNCKKKGIALKPSLASEAIHEVNFVKYDIDGTKNPQFYPHCQIPVVGTVIRSYGKGKICLRGYKEISFEKTLHSLFVNNISIQGDCILNTGKYIRPYEPDIALIAKFKNLKIFIDIEIDEPYTGISRHPTHCIGDDLHRDNYFINRGWIVIRFSELQIQVQELSCAKFIAQIIKIIAPDFDIPIELKNIPDLVEEKKWTTLQAQKWEQGNYREKYLNHTFKSQEESQDPKTFYIKDYETIEESFVLPSPLNVEESKSSLHNLKNKSSRDTNITFNKRTHTYFIKNRPATAVSKLIEKFFPEFDPNNAAKSLNQNHKMYGKKVEEIINYWETKNSIAAEQGTYLHKQIENYFLEAEYDRIDCINLFLNFINDSENIVPYRTEWKVYDEKFCVAGTIDLISKKDNEFVLYDWKRSTKIIDIETGQPVTYNAYSEGLGKLQHVSDTAFNRYSLQQSIYRYILEKNYKLPITKMKLVILHPSYENYYELDVPYLKKEAEYILQFQSEK